MSDFTGLNAMTIETDLPPGAKESSPLGLLHTGMTDKMVKACCEEYPELEADIERFRKNPGLVVYLFDTLVALGPLEHLEGDGQKGAEHERVPTQEDDIESLDIPLKLQRQ